MHDPGQPEQGCVVGEVVIVDQDLEGALAAAVFVGGARRVEATGLFPFGGAQDVLGRDVDDLGLRVEEAADQPRAGDPVGLGACARDPTS